jgi:hypothetical protein
MLIQLSEVKELLRKATPFVPLTDAGRVEYLLEPLVLSRYRSELIVQVPDAVVVMALIRVPHVLTLAAAEDYCRAVALVFEYVGVGHDLFAPAVSVAALKLDLGEEVARDPVDLVELGIRPAEGAVIGVLRKPVTLAVRADRFLANLTLQWIL